MEHVQTKSDATQFKMIVTEFLIIMVTIAGMFFWSRSETMADTRRIEDLMHNMHREIQLEMKDFHGRLCSIEERNRGK
jgi:hypothetical protein